MNLLVSGGANLPKRITQSIQQKTKSGDSGNEVWRLWQRACIGIFNLDELVAKSIGLLAAIVLLTGEEKA